MIHLHVPPAWRQMADAVRAEKPRVILVLGAGDMGKTACCRFLVRELNAAGHRVAMVDADIGQKDIGPPATVTLGYAEGGTERSAIAPQAFYFVGSTSPAGRFLPLVVGAARLVGQADAPFVIVDTTGFVEGSGRALKGYKIEALRPDLIVAIEKRDELESILRPCRAVRTLRIRPSRKARPRDDLERDLARERGFYTYFKDARRVETELDRVAVQRSLLFTGTPVAIEGAVYAERTAEGVIAIAEKPIPGPDAVKTLRPGFERNLLCGVADERGDGRGLAILERIDFAARTLSLLTPVAAEQIAVLQFGDLYIGADGRELGRAPAGGW